MRLGRDIHSLLTSLFVITVLSGAQTTRDSSERSRIMGGRKNIKDKTGCPFGALFTMKQLTG